MELEKWTPPSKIEEIFEKTAGNAFAAINSPTSGARVTQDLPRGKASFQYYSLGTPNGQKPGIMLEELGIDYDAHCIDATYYYQHSMKKYIYSYLITFLFLKL